MTQPSFVPITEADQVRRALRLSQPHHWRLGRPGDLRAPGQPVGRRLGTPGPDQGFALSLVRRIKDQLVLAEGEHEEDVMEGLAMIASRRSALFGRAPSIHDVRVAATVWGFFDASAASELCATRREAFSGVAHDYVRQRELAERMPVETLRLPVQRAGTPGINWRQLLGC
jgi:hypothetical protein